MNGQYYHNGIDRKDPKLGYTKENCVSCCKYCNLGKNDQTYEDYLQRVEQIYNVLLRKGTYKNLVKEALNER